MNVIVLNEKKELNNLNIDIIKNVDGVYSVEELIGMFTNFFFNKMILDITAVKDYTDYSNLKKLFQTVDGNKVIVYLNDIANTKEFISDLITLGVYNFTTNYDEIITLFNSPKRFDDVKDLQISKNTYDINSEIDESLGVNQEKDFTFEDFILPGEYDGNKKIIGVVNLTSHAGATTLVVQMIKQLNINYKAIGIEMNKQDFIFFNTPYLYSCVSREDVLKKIKEHKDVDAVIVDLNNVDSKDFCTDVIYLIEPGTIKLTKLIKGNSKVFEELSGEKIILNRTNMDAKQVSEFEVESKIKVFSVVSNFRDNLDRVISVDRLLSKLGYIKCLDGEKSVKKFSLFGKNK